VKAPCDSAQPHLRGRPGPAFGFYAAFDAGLGAATPCPCSGNDAITSNSVQDSICGGIFMRGPRDCGYRPPLGATETLLEGQPRLRIASNLSWTLHACDSR
jgi:hypothetical protein